jgi:hypothetical protein
VALVEAIEELHNPGNGDLILTPPWRVLGPLEAANGMFMFGVTTALVFAVI